MELALLYSVDPVPQFTWITGESSKFRRTLTSQKTVPESDEIKISCTTTRLESGNIEKITISEVLTDWKQH